MTSSKSLNTILPAGLSLMVISKYTFENGSGLYDGAVDSAFYDFIKLITI